MDDKPAETSPSEESKRKFREALDKKKKTAQSGPAHLDGDSAVHGTQGRASGKREFMRRKSG